MHATRTIATREAVLPTATSCTSPTKIFTWASPRCRPAPYVERQPWQVVGRTAQAHRRHSTWTQACAAQAHTAMRAAHTRRTRACTTLTCAHQRRGGRVRGGEQGRQQALHRHKGRWGTHGSRAGTGYGVDTISASSVWANRGRATTNCTGTPNASERRLLACACTCAATCQHPPGGRPARAPRAPAAAAPPRPHRAPGAPPLKQTFSPSLYPSHPSKISQNRANMDVHPWMDTGENSCPLQRPSLSRILEPLPALGETPPRCPCYPHLLLL